MSYTLIIRNCKLPILGQLFNADLLIDGEKIAGFSKSGLVKADTYYDAKGLLALPGGIDSHVHFRDPSSSHAEDFETGSLAAAHGGVTTVADMPNTEPSVTNSEVLKLKLEWVKGRAYVDYMLHGGTGKTSLSNVIGLAEAGVAAVKTFMTGRFESLSSPDTETLKIAIIETRKADIPLMVHAEDLGAMVESSKGGAIRYAIMRSCICESVAVARVAELARQLGGHVHFVHISCADSVKIIRLYKQIGARLTAETTPPYLSLTINEFEKKGVYAKLDPPLRTPADVDELWEAILHGDIDFVASDHAPYGRDEKEKGVEEIELAPSGMPGVETTLPFLLDRCFHLKVLSLGRLIEVFSASPAKFLGIYPKKGTLNPGADADIVLVDPKREFKVSVENLITITKQSIFEGTSFIGRPTAMFLRGTQILEDKETLTKPKGTFIKRGYGT